jgi:hypothetical protein
MNPSRGRRGPNSNDQRPSNQPAPGDHGITMHKNYDQTNSPVVPRKLRM